MQVLRGVPTGRSFYAIGPLIAIERSNLKSSYSGNTYPVRFLLFSI